MNTNCSNHMPLSDDHRSSMLALAEAVARTRLKVLVYHDGVDSVRVMFDALTAAEAARVVQVAEAAVDGA